MSNFITCTSTKKEKSTVFTTLTLKIRLVLRMIIRKASWIRKESNLHNRARRTYVDFLDLADVSVMSLIPLRFVCIDMWTRINKSGNWHIPRKSSIRMFSRYSVRVSFWKFIWNISWHAFEDFTQNFFRFFSRYFSWYFFRISIDIRTFLGFLLKNLPGFLNSDDLS